MSAGEFWGAADESPPTRRRPASRADRSLDDRVPFLARLEQAERESLLVLGRTIRYPARSVVIRQEEPSAHVLLIVHGWLKVTVSAVNGYEALLALRGPGDIVGESAAVSGRPRSATVTSLESVEAVAVDQDQFTDYLHRTPHAALQLLSLTVDRLRSGDQRRLEFGALTVSERLSGLLLELARAHGITTDEGIVVAVPLSQQELAGSVGASREAVTRLLRVLRERGVIATNRRRLVILRPELLRRTDQIYD
ncbi:Crp/Fnr family transcriptional regulator [Streptacidiphilus sp. EB103A]|uniref:Crp/Fnr family transcriptional regulator n=1 Tax=Streptacidiphilus sp. EB103A TaxID=3156275 RepID=UPI0035124E1C